jgi:methylthioribose-1-phosphate isomerase
MICPYEWNHTSLRILDQTQLPINDVYETLQTLEDVRLAIFQLKIRGAPAIGICGAYGLLLGIQALPTQERTLSKVCQLAEYLEKVRPTAVNLRYALQRIVSVCENTHPDSWMTALELEARALYEEDIRSCRAIGESGVSLLKDGCRVLTHCNAGVLATSQYGTALAPLYLAHERGIQFKVYADETRPLLQGARLTAWELHKAGIDVTVLCDNMVAHMMKSGEIDMVFTGCDRVAANGDAANKIGTLGVAILAKFYHIPFYICAPRSTFDSQCATGADIRIEERAPEEVTSMWYRQPMVPEGVKVRNPAFDVTDESLITGYITDDGILTTHLFQLAMAKV